MATADPERLREWLDTLYLRYNRRESARSDPVAFLYDYADPQDREVVGLVASSLAYGRVAQIRASVARVLERMPEPARFLGRVSRSALGRTFSDFRHRFTSGPELAAFLMGVKGVLRRHGSLEALFMSGLRRGDETVVPALGEFVAALQREGAGPSNSLLACPARGSACKRLHLFLRWMVRRDQVDPGGWNGVTPAQLIVPLDTHMHRMGRRLNLTGRKQADLGTATELTRAFRRLAPEDPVRYDFALTRYGMGEGERGGRQDGPPQLARRVE